MKSLVSVLVLAGFLTVFLAAVVSAYFALEGLLTRRRNRNSSDDGNGGEP